MTSDLSLLNAMPSPAPAAMPTHLAAHSRLVQRVRRRHADELPLLLPGTPRADTMQQCLAALRARGLALGAALRVLRQLVLERLCVLDCEAGLPLTQVCHAMTDLAELALELACTEAQTQLQARHGPVLDAAGQPVRLWIIGMGKLGARELNVSSDIDLIYVYERDGRSTGMPDGSGQHTGQLSAQDWFVRATRVIHELIGEFTEHGQVFRIDLALRPNGHSGAPVLSLDALADYLGSQGREWERFAWMKSRVVAPRAALRDGTALTLRELVLPFVFRQYLDYGVFEALRELHRQVRAHASQRSAGRPARDNDVKLSRGGIREIEFIVQLLQIVRGGQFPELRARPTLKALQRLERAGLMSPAQALALAQAYDFLRRTEHRIQYLDDQQTHVVPTARDDLRWLAHTMGQPDARAFAAVLSEHREAVAAAFDQILGETPLCAEATSQDQTQAPAQSAPEQMQAAADQVDSSAVRAELSQWLQSPRLQELAPNAQRRLLPLIERTTQWLSEARVSDTAVLRFIDWLDPLLRRAGYLAQLLERPEVHLRLLRVLGTARWPARYLMQHPGVIDELADTRLLDARFDAAALEGELHARRAALARSGEDDEENLLDLLRRAHHAEMFRTLLRDIEGRLSVEQVADELSALADTMLRVALAWCWSLLRRRHRPEPRLGIIGYGKLGGKELGYGSDLDLVFVFDDEHERAPEIYAALVRKLINWLTLKTSEGDLYEIDTALRPNGSAGLLVTRFQAYADYQQQRGSNTAATWEHQAMTRARMVPPRSTAMPVALPPEGAVPALGRPDGAGMVPPHGSASGGLPSSAQAALPPRPLWGEGWGEGVHPPDAQHSASPPFDLTARFDAVRQTVITAERDRPALRAEIRAMRQRIQGAYPVPADRFDLKYSPGGMMDAEFVTQYLVLAHSAEHPGLIPNLGNIALLVHAESVGLLPTGSGQAAADAYRHLRQLQHQARLDDRSAQLPAAELQAERAAILALWRAVFDDAAEPA